MVMLADLPLAVARRAAEIGRGATAPTDPSDEISESGADLVALQATPSLRAAIHGGAVITPAGNVRGDAASADADDG